MKLHIPLRAASSFSNQCSGTIYRVGCSLINLLLINARSTQSLISWLCRSAWYRQSLALYHWNWSKNTFSLLPRALMKKPHPTQNTAGFGKLGIPSGFRSSVLFGEFAEHSNCIILVLASCPWSKVWANLTVTWHRNSTSQWRSAGLLHCTTVAC